MKKKSLYFKLTIILLALVIVPALTYLVLFVGSTSKASFDNYYSSNKLILNGINSRLEDYTTQLETYVDFIYFKQLQSDEGGLLEDVENKIEYIFAQKEEFESIQIYNSESKNFYVYNRNGLKKYADSADMENQGWYRTIWTSISRFNINAQHFHVNYADRYDVDRDQEVFSFVKKYDLVNNERIVIIINCKNYELRSICSNAIDNREEVIQALNKYGEIVYSTSKTFSIYDRNDIYDYIIKQPNKSGQFQFTSQKDGLNKTVVFVRSIINNNIYFKCLNDSILNKNLSVGIKLMLIIFTISMLIIGLISVLLGKWFLRPLLKLKIGIDKFAEGKIDVKLVIERNDEIGEIASSFNIMAENTEKLIKDKYELEIYNRNAQYYSLMAQINPHFINNVLQCIGAIGLEKDSVEVYSATMMLAKMMRYSIKEQDVVPLKNEVENIEDYSKIQKMRFEEKISWEIDVDKALENMLIPKLTLQPLLENSVVHGLEKKKGKGEIYFSVKKIGNSAVITIADNGIGMSEERLKELQESITISTFDIERKRIGVSNVYHRLKIMYKEDCEMTIQSEKNKGTTTTIRIKLR